MLCLGFIFGCMFGGIWLHFYCYFGRCWEVFFGTFSDFVKNGAPHGNAVHNSKNEGPAPRKSRKNIQKPNTNQIKISVELYVRVGRISTAFWEPVGVWTHIKNQTCFFIDVDSCLHETWCQKRGQRDLKSRHLLSISGAYPQDPTQEATCTQHSPNLKLTSMKYELKMQSKRNEIIRFVYTWFAFSFFAVAGLQHQIRTSWGL